MSFDAMHGHDVTLGHDLPHCNKNHAFTHSICYFSLKHIIQYTYMQVARARSALRWCPWLYENVMAGNLHVDLVSLTKQGAGHCCLMRQWVV